MHVIPRRFVVAALFCAGLMASVASALAEAPGNERVICPAIARELTPRLQECYISSIPISLVVLGKYDTDRAQDGCRFLIEKTLYGSYGEKMLHVEAPAPPALNVSEIRAYRASVYSDDLLELRYTASPCEEYAEAALSAARLDFYVLSSTFIFTGKELDADDHYLRTVDVARSLRGPKLDGQRVTILLDGYMRTSGELPRMNPEEMIYLIGSARLGRKLSVPEAKERETIYEVLTCLRAGQEQNVLAALRRRDAHPLVEKEDENGEKRHYREIMFQGSISEAAELMASANEAAVTLGSRFLLHNKDKARQEIDAAIDKDLLRFTAGSMGSYRRLRNLIHLMGTMGQDTTPGDLAQAIEKLAGFIDTNPPEPPAPVREADRWYVQWYGEEGMDDVNHALAWMLFAMDESDLLRNHAQRLLRLRDNARGRWKDEVQLALDAANVEDNIALAAAEAASKALKHFRLEPAIRAAGEAVAFSHDSRCLAVGEMLWNVKDWTRVGGSDEIGPSSQVAFSPDDKALYLSDACQVRRFDWRARTAERLYYKEEGGLFFSAISADRSRLATASYDGQILVHDTASGRILKTIELPRDCYRLAFSPDGKTIVHNTPMNELAIHPVDGGESRALPFGKDPLSGVAFSPDGRYLIVAISVHRAPTEAGSVVRLLVHDVRQGYKQVGDKVTDAPGCREVMAVSNNSSYVVLAESRCPVWVISLPDLKAARQLIAESGSYSHGSVAFSPDGRLLAIGSGYDSVRLFDARTLQPTEPPPGHTGGISSVFFSVDGTTLRTIGKREVCLWDAATMQLTKTLPLPAGTTCVSARTQDGKYALCASSYHLEPCLGSRKETIPPVKVVDLDDASVVCETDLPVHWINADRRVLWLDDSEAIIADYPSWQRFNYRTGARLKPVDPGKDFGLGRCLSDDGKTFFSISGGLLCGSVELLRFSLESGQTVTVGKTWPPRFTGNAMGLVPGGRYFYVADPGMYIFDRDSLRLVAQKRLNGKDLLSIAFNRSGSRCAVAIGARKFVSERGIFDPGIDVVLCVYETLSGKTLFALPLHERYVRNIAFSRADDRLAVVTDSGAVELWKLPPASP